jgi:hypothetical protein
LRLDVCAGTIRLFAATGFWTDCVAFHKAKKSYLTRACPTQPDWNTVGLFLFQRDKQCYLKSPNIFRRKRSNLITLSL